MQGKPTLTTVVINGVTVDSYLIKWKLDKEFNETIADISIVLTKGVDAVLTIDDESTGWTVTVQRGVSLATEEYVFRGEVVNVMLTGSTYEFYCLDKLNEARRTRLTKTYDINIDPEAGVISDIFTDLITSYTSMTADATSVQASGAVFTLKKFVCRNSTVYERIDALAQAMNWQFYYDPINDKVYFEPKGFSAGADVLQVGDNIVTVPVWVYNSEKLVNKLTVRGAEILVEKTEFKNGTGAQAQFVALTYQPVSVKVFVDGASNDPYGAGTRPSDDENNLQTGGKIDATSGTFYFDYDEDPAIKKVYFYDATRGTQPSGTPSNHTSNIEVRYSYRLPTPVVGKNQPSIDKYGLHENVVTRTDVKNIADAEVYVNKQLSKFSEVFISSTLKVADVSDMKVGRIYNCVDGNNSVNSNLIITKIVMEYPYRFDEATVGDELWRTADWDTEVEDRIKKLEEKESESTDLLVNIFDLTRDIKPRRRYNWIRRDKIFDSFILGHQVNGLLGMGKIIENFEAGADANWAEGASVTDNDNAVTYLVGTGSLQVVFGATGSRTITTTQSFGDVSSYTGVANGSPSQGTCGVWWNSPNTTGITAIKLRIGSGVSDYIECTGREYGSVDGYNNWGSLVFGLNSGWNYYLFDLDNPDSVSGTPDWTACDYARFEFTVASTHTGYLDYFTISSSDYIGLNGLGDRSQTIGDPAKLVQGNMTYREYCYDTDFHDAVNSTATFSTVTYDILFATTEIWYSNVIDLGTTLSYITVDLGDTIGTLLIEISSDNKVSWQTVTEGVKTAVSSSDGLGTYVRITATDGDSVLFGTGGIGFPIVFGAGYITNTENTFGERTAPAIKILMEEI